MENKSAYIVGLEEVDKTKLALVGGKGANLGELSGIEGLKVPAGFCITTEAYKEIVENNAEVSSLLAALTDLKVDDRGKISEVSGKIRAAIENIAIPKNVADEMAAYLAKFDKKDAFAVRSSATAEDLPTASFAGQQDTYLNVTGEEEVLLHISKCWASLFTDRAVTYRIQTAGSAVLFDHRKVRLSIIVQQMVFSEVAGIMFTADPISANRKVISIDASFGLGEVLVSGLVNADNYKVLNGQVFEKKISNKKLSINVVAGGGTREQEIEIERQDKQALTDEQILELADIGRKIEAHFGSPQDIEWCLAGGTFYVVQSRPITTLFPIPEANDAKNAVGCPHVYVSVGHQQMMTDAMKPLGLSFFLSLSPGRMCTAGGRLFVDVAKELASPVSRNIILNTTLGKSDPLSKDALLTILERKDFIEVLPAENPIGKDQTETADNPSQNAKKRSANPPIASETATSVTNASEMTASVEVVNELIERSEQLVEELKQRIQNKTGADLIDFILEDIQEWRKYLFDPRSYGILMAGINAMSWANEKMNEWLGEKNAADTLSQSVPNNVTSEMGLALLDVADAIRPYPEVIAYLQNVKDENFLEALPSLKGGRETRAAIGAFLEKYGMRCAGEIDITRTRWAEKPATLIPVILGNIKNFTQHASIRKFEQGKQEALKKEQELLSRLRQLPDGEHKAKETKQRIDMIRNLVGYREYPKYGLVSRSFVYRTALLKEAERLVQAKVLHEKEDIYYLNLAELAQVIHSNELDHEIISQRKEDFKRFEKLTPPRVMTSDGEIITGRYKRENIPAGTIVGLAVSSGVIEGRARVILNMEDADIEEGDILVTTFTDPSWTPLFVSIKGLITEVGGIMTHGAVIAREYGLPAVVGVEHATKVIKDGQRIRVNGTEGWVEII
ncbi:phosphoenolpyruvate synthase [Dyadobacter chenwenxiniae]|uniref:Prodigiosin synthesizing transferase PigC n=1 Tax=Dyadobacter chenwenxiniae TaxID=2906456 RepID=A0A9X1TDD6_9BACT|nr:phosphoenolpyruvate synthase [Dyadobacter chenwenxiniae]MCF0061826.1 phosphoenolpyruvate synthase [Dyadobacter chenwenxiniae]UON81641.1 phosphoenolpyruvate synthase [Dyadobacter chenwenxiniae]